MRRVSFHSLLLMVLLTTVPTGAQESPQRALVLLTAERTAARAALEMSADRPLLAEERLALAEQLLKTGLAVEAEALLNEATDALSGEQDGLALRFDCDLALGEFARAAARSEALEDRATDSPAARLASFDALLLIGDLRTANKRTKRAPEGDAVGLLCRALLAQHLNDNSRAEGLFEAAMAAGAPAGRCLLGLSAVTRDQNRIDEAMRLAERALAEEGVTGALLLHWGGLLVRNGEAADAVRVFEAVAGAYPWSARAHYQLGNGYARRNYTELERDSPDAFSPRAGQAAPSDPKLFTSLLADAKQALADGRFQDAESAFKTVNEFWPAACEAPTALASMAWVSGDYRAAERWCREALKREPAHGRAHAVLAKALASRRSAIDVHRQADERNFARQSFPRIPGVEEFVLNWDALSERHAKRLALSLAPFAQYIPVLVAGGQTFYVKQLHERLSECPGHTSLKDERISYDARLWDDVRGCGGNDTVIGIEDVENSIFAGSDTALHELAHQVHGILAEDENSSIERAYTQALARDAAGEDSFVNRYQASSVWEYLAEGVHSYETPRRDRWDTRQALKHRLLERDPALVKLVRRLLNERAPNRFLAPALVTRAWNEVSYGRLEEGWGHLKKAMAVDSVDEAVLTAQLWFMVYGGEAEVAAKAAELAVVDRPSSASVALVAASAEVHGRGDRDAALTLLSKALPRVDTGRRQDIEAALASLQFEQGDTKAAVLGYLAILKDREDDPSALQGLLNCLMMQEPRAGDDFEDVLARLVRKRSGVRTVRADAALALARRGDFTAARDQVREGLLNAPDSDHVLAAAACVELWAGETELALNLAEQALKVSGGPDSGWNDSALLVRALASIKDEPERSRADLLRLQERRESGPFYLYIEAENEWRSVHRFAPLEGQLMTELESLLAPSGEDS